MKKLIILFCLLATGAFGQAISSTNIVTNYPAVSFGVSSNGTPTFNGFDLYGQINLAASNAANFSLAQYAPTSYVATAIATFPLNYSNITNLPSATSYTNLRVFNSFNLGSNSTFVLMTNVIAITGTGTNIGNYYFAVNKFTNQFGNGLYYTNNGSLYQLRDGQNTILATSPTLTGTNWTLQNGGAAPTNAAYAYAEYEIGLIHLGPIDSTNLTAQIISTVGGLTNYQALTNISTSVAGSMLSSFASTGTVAIATAALTATNAPSGAGLADTNMVNQAIAQQPVVQATVSNGNLLLLITNPLALITNLTLIGSNWTPNLSVTVSNSAWGAYSQLGAMGLTMTGVKVFGLNTNTISIDNALNATANFPASDGMTNLNGTWWSTNYALSRITNASPGLWRYYGTNGTSTCTNGALYGAYPKEASGGNPIPTVKGTFTQNLQ